MDIWSSFEVTSSKQAVVHNSFYANYPGDKFIVSEILITFVSNLLLKFCDS